MKPILSPSSPWRSSLAPRRRPLHRLLKALTASLRLVMQWRSPRPCELGVTSFFAGIGFAPEMRQGRSAIPLSPPHLAL